MNMQYNWVQTAVEDAPWPYPMEESDPVAEGKDLAAKPKGPVLTIVKPPMPKEKAAEPKSGPDRDAGALGAKIKEAIQTDYDPEQSLAAIRAILVGPTRQLHDARIEEIVSILEESDRANQNSFRVLENRCQELSAKLDAEVKKATDLQLRYLAEFSFAVDKKFELTHSELNGRLAEHAGQSQAAITQLSHQFTVQFKDHDRKMACTFASLTETFENRFLKLDEQADQLHQRSAAVFMEGLNDIAKRITALKRKGS